MRKRNTKLQALLGCEVLEAKHLLAGDLIAQWQATALASDHADGSEIAIWHDTVASIPATSQGTPRLIEQGIGGRASLALDPTDQPDHLVIDGAVSPMLAALDFTVAVVFSTESQTLSGEQAEWFRNTAIVDANALGFSNDWGISINSSGRVGAGLGFGFGSAPITLYTESEGWNDGNWHVAVYRREATTISLQVDDSPVVSQAAHDAPLSELDFSIGAHNFGEFPFAGMVAEVRIYDGALSAAETDELRQQLNSFYDNARPQAAADDYELNEDQGVFFITAGQGVLANDLDPDSDPLTAVMVRGPSHGEVALEPDGSFLYDPFEDFYGTDTFQYSAFDFRASPPATVTLIVHPKHDPPRPVVDSYQATPGQLLQVSTADGVLANDVNVDQAELVAVVDQDVSHGRLTLRPDGSFEYDPQGFAGTTQFSYRADDGTALTAPVLVTIVSNTAPVAADDEYQVSEDSLLQVDLLSGVTSNDHDADGNPLTLELERPPEHGTLELLPDGSFVYSPRPDFFGDDTFSYLVRDEFDESAPAEVRIRVLPVNDPPLTNADDYVGLPDRLLEVSVERGLLANDQDVDAATLTVRVIQAPAHGTLDLNSDGSLTFRPDDGFVGSDSFTYRASDSVDESADTVVNLIVTTTPIVISEFMATNSSHLSTRIPESPGGDLVREPLTPDWIELQNLVTQPLDLSGMHLTDDEKLPNKWTFPDGTVIPERGRLLVYASGFDITNPALDSNGRLHTNFTLAQDGEYLALTLPDGVAISEFAPQYPPQRVDVSYGRSEDTDLYFAKPTPGSPNADGIRGIVADTSFSIDRGFFTEPFTVEITTETPGASIVYTTNGTTPTPTNGTVVTASNADQSPIAAVGITGLTTLRAAAFAPDLLPTNVDTHTYVFVADVVDRQRLSSTVKDHPEWGPRLESSLLALPSISLVLPGRVSTSERPTSVELIYPDGSQGFQIDAGVEHYGGASINSPKKNMRLSFKSEYGDASLKYDLFGSGAVTEFQQILLRTGSHDTFFWTHPGGGRGNYVRNRWAFDRQLEMGQIAPHGRYVHVYINGDYWGMHHLMERPNAHFMASYLGGHSFQYDALNAGTPVDGTIEAWSRLQRNEVIDDYQQLQQYLDLDNYADYMLLQFFAGNDWDWGTNHNWMSARKREEGAGYMFFAWDSDVMLRSSANANVINLGGPGNLWNVRGGVKQHLEFRMLMADRAQRYFFDGGMFTNERFRSDILALADRIRLPIIAETARWGGSTYTPRTWQSAIDWMLDRYAPENSRNRSETVLSQLRRADIFPSIDAPYFAVNQQTVLEANLQIDDLFSIAAAAGEVYFTLDGTDPRLPGGDINPDAILATGAPIGLNSSATVKARALHEGEWSTLREGTFRINTVPADATNIRIAEVHYHPSNPTAAERSAGIGDADDFEFIELVNISGNTLDLSSLEFVQLQVGNDTHGVAFDFQHSDVPELASGQRVVVVEDLAAFRVRYGSDVLVAGQWIGGLSNQSETVTLSANEEVILQFTYEDDWQPLTDGLGHSLQANRESSSDLTAWQRSDGWRASHRPHGSPGSADFGIIGDANRDGLFDSSDLVAIFTAGKYEDAVDNNASWEEGDWNGDGEFDSSDLVLAFASGGYTDQAIAAIDAIFRSGSIGPQRDQR